MIVLRITRDPESPLVLPLGEKGPFGSFPTSMQIRIGNQCLTLALFLLQTFLSSGPVYVARTFAPLVLAVWSCRLFQYSLRMNPLALVFLMWTATVYVRNEVVIIVIITRGRWICRCRKSSGNFHVLSLFGASFRGLGINHVLASVRPCRAGRRYLHTSIKLRSIISDLSSGVAKRNDITRYQCRVGIRNRLIWRVNSPLSHSQMRYCQRVILRRKDLPSGYFSHPPIWISPGAALGAV